MDCSSEQREVSTMALQLNWTHTATDVTYNNAYATITDVSCLKDKIDGDYKLMATVQVYKNAAAYANGKKPVARTKYSKVLNIQSNDTVANYRNAVCQTYLYMKQDAPWSTAVDV